MTTQYRCMGAICMTFRLRLKYVLIFITITVVWMNVYLFHGVVMPGKLLRNVASSMTSYYNASNVHRLGNILVDVTQFGRTLKQHQKHKGSIIPQLADCLNYSKCQSKAGKCTHKAIFKNTFECRHLMFAKRNLGRTGNQMFQLAALLGTASHHGYTPVIDSKMSVAAWFDLPNLSNITLPKATMKTFGEKSCCKYDDRVKKLTHSTNWTLNGYYQSWRYFKGAEDIIKTAFVIKKVFMSDAKKFIKSTVTSGVSTVCIHVRRGDFVGLKSAKRGYTMAPLSYIKKAVEYFRNKFRKVHFFAISDDKKWCADNLRWRGVNVTVSPFNTAGHDMALMVTSDHVVVTSGSFGWWGAWLAGGDAVYWTGFPGNGTWLGKQTNVEEYYPAHWVGLS